jgi:hypothetical protein
MKVDPFSCQPQLVQYHTLNCDKHTLTCVLLDSFQFTQQRCQYNALRQSRSTASTFHCVLSLSGCCFSDSFFYVSPEDPTSSPCSVFPTPCKVVRVVATQTLEHIAAIHGTTTWRIWKDNHYLHSDFDVKVLLRPNDVLVVRPSPGLEKLRWQWTNKAGTALVSMHLGSVCWGWQTMLGMASPY